MGTYRLALPTEKYGTIYADPPWMLRSGGVLRKLVYDTMTTPEIMALPVQDLAAPDCHLWLWTTNPHLPEAFEVMRAWGFEYKSTLTWVKPRMGLGWWLRSKTEHLLLGVRGHYRVQPGAITTVLAAPWRGHSVKPEEVIPIIEKLSPAPRIELFARCSREGWTCMTSDAPPVGDPYGTGYGE